MTNSLISTILLSKVLTISVLASFSSLFIFLVEIFETCRNSPHVCFSQPSEFRCHNFSNRSLIFFYLKGAFSSHSFLFLLPVTFTSLVLSNCRTTDWYLTGKLFGFLQLFYEMKRIFLTHVFSNCLFCSVPFLHSRTIATSA